MSSFLENDQIGDIEFWNKRHVSVIPGINFSVGRDFDHYYEDLHNIANAFGKQVESENYMSEQRNQIEAIRNESSKAANSPNVLLISGVEGRKYDYYSRGFSLVDDMVDVAGGTYMELSDANSIELSLESIISANPDKIITADFRGPGGTERMLKDDRLKNVTAIRNNDVTTVDYTKTIYGSLDIAKSTQKLAEFIHPETFDAK